MFKKFSSAVIDRRNIFASKSRASSIVTSDFEFTPKPGMLYSSVRAISSRINRNFDGFPSQELKKAASTFIGRPVFVNHNNSDHKKTRGMILDSKYKEQGDDKYIQLLIEVDAKNFPKLAKKIESGEIDAVSMGTDCQYTVCTVCDNKAYGWLEFCDHIPAMKGKTLPHEVTGKMTICAELCYDLTFFEISFVFDPADETALLIDVWKTSSMNKKSYGETMAPEKVDTLRVEEPCAQCGNEVESGEPCKICGFEPPIKALGDPDTSIAQQTDLRQDANEEGQVNSVENAQGEASANEPPSSDPELGSRVQTLSDGGKNSNDDKGDEVSDKDKEGEGENKALKAALMSQRISRAIKIAEERDPEQLGQPEQPEQPDSDVEWEGDDSSKVASFNDYALVTYKLGARVFSEVHDSEGQLIVRAFPNFKKAQEFATSFVLDVIKMVAK